MITVAFLRTLPGLCKDHLDNLAELVGETTPLEPAATVAAYLDRYPNRIGGVARVAMVLTVARGKDRAWIFRVADVGLRAAGLGRLGPCGPETWRAINVIDYATDAYYVAIASRYAADAADAASYAAADAYAAAADAYTAAYTADAASYAAAYADYAAAARAEIAAICIAAMQEALS